MLFRLPSFSRTLAIGLSIVVFSLVNHPLNSFTARVKQRIKVFTIPTKNKQQWNYHNCRQENAKERVNLLLSMVESDVFSTKIITCSTTKELVRAVSTIVKPGHRVAELGSQLREVSTTICESLLQNTTNIDRLNSQQSSAILVDVKRKFPKSGELEGRTSAMRQSAEAGVDFFPSVSQFIEINQLGNWRKAFFQEKSSVGSTPIYDVLVVDINSIVGNDLEWTALSIIQDFEALNQQSSKSSLIVMIKSDALHKFSKRIVHGVRWVNQQGRNIAIGPPYIVATTGVQQYRSSIPFTVKPDDAILEVGCHFGTTTALLQKASPEGYCLGVDVGKKIIQEANKKYPNIFFRVGDAWRTAGLLRIQQEFYRENPSIKNQKIGFDIVYIDVGGLSGSDGLLEAISLISSIRYALEPRCIVIKSLCMQRLSSTLIPYWQAQKLMVKSK